MDQEVYPQVMCVCVCVCSFVIIIAFNVLGRYKKMENSLLG